MKKAVLLNLLLTLFYSSYSQSYIPLLKEGNQWNVLYENNYIAVKSTENTTQQHNYNCKSTNYDAGYLKTEICKVSSDTIVNKITYKKIISSYDSLSNNWSLKYLLREDTTTQKVYYLENNIEMTLYDFSLSVNDTFYNNTVQTVDTVFINQKPHKRIQLTGYGNIWIEGIGSILGITTKGQPMCGPLVSLLCMFNNNNLIYHNDQSMHDECFYWETSEGSGINSINKLSYAISPNPAKGIINIETENTERSNIELLNLQGQVQLRKNDVFKKTQLNVTEIKKGFYFIRITNNKGLLTYKILIQ